MAQAQTCKRLPTKLQLVDIMVADKEKIMVPMEAVEAVAVLILEQELVHCAIMEILQAF